MMYRQTLNVPNGRITVTDFTREEVVRQVVSMAVRDGARPKIHWWQYWLDEWPEDCAEEYNRITLKSKETE